MKSRFRLAVAAALALASVAAQGQEDRLATARDLYTSAAYEDALTILNGLRGKDRRPDEQRAVEQYRAFCLLALGRTFDAERAIEAVVVAEPSYVPSDADASPRIRTAFSEVRRRVLPGIIQDKYTSAKAAFDRKDFAVAQIAFAQVLNAIADPDVSSVAGKPPLSDLRTLAVGFHELSVNAATPPLPPIVPEPVAAFATGPIPQRAAVAAPRIYGLGEPGVVPPVVIKQWLPQFPTQVIVPGQGVLEVIIDETGAVESAMMRVALNSKYDEMAVEAAKTWQFKPATFHGVPVKFRKILNVNLKPTAR